MEGSDVAEVVEVILEMAWPLSAPFGAGSLLSKFESRGIIERGLVGLPSESGREGRYLPPTPPF